MFFVCIYVFYLIHVNLLVVCAVHQGIWLYVLYVLVCFVPYF